MNNFMLQAIQLGERGRLTAPPNPWVGCVIVKNNRIIGEGYHHHPGDCHAEIVALKQAGINSIDSTVYTTLEPCCHDGFTPPCVDALIKNKVRKVVIGVQDPDQRVSGNGITQLRKAGIEVQEGEYKKEVEKSLAPYLHHRKMKTPYIIAKAAISIDGRIAASDGSSKWISSKEARVDAHRLRAESQGVLVGSVTAKKDTPALTVRDYPSPQQPTRIVIDSLGKHEGNHWIKESSPVLILTTKKSSRIIEWKDLGLEVVILPEKDHHIDLHAAMEYLGQRGFIQILVEGGGGLHAAFLENSLINQLTVYVGPKILGSKGVPLFPIDYISHIQAAPHLELVDSKTFGDTIRLDYMPQIF